MFAHAGRCDNPQSAAFLATLRLHGAPRRAHARSQAKPGEWFGGRTNHPKRLRALRLTVPGRLGILHVIDQ